MIENTYLCHMGVEKLTHLSSAINPCSIDLTSIYGSITLTEKFWGFEKRACGRVCRSGPWSRWCISSTWGAHKCSPILWVAWRQYCVWRCKLPFPVLSAICHSICICGSIYPGYFSTVTILMQLVVLVFKQKIHMIFEICNCSSGQLELGILVISPLKCLIELLQKIQSLCSYMVLLLVARM